jgi:hypothetical protein
MGTQHYSKSMNAQNYGSPTPFQLQFQMRLGTKKRYQFMFCPNFFAQPGPYSAKNQALFRWANHRRGWKKCAKKNMSGWFLHILVFSSINPTWVTD